MLKKSKSASDIVLVLERMNKENKIVFRQLAEGRQGEYHRYSNKILLKNALKEEDVSTIAITLAHEGQHAVDRFRFITLLTWEVRAFEAEAKIWPEIVNRKEYYHWRQEEIIGAYESGNLREYVKERYATGIVGKLLYSY